MTPLLLAVEAVVLVTAMFGAATETSIEAVSSPCHEVQYLEKLISHFEENLSSARSRAAELSNDYSLLTLAAVCTEDPQTATAYIALSGDTKEAELQQREALKAGEGAITELVQTLRSRVSQTKALIHAEKDKLETETATSPTASKTFLSQSADKQCAIPTSKSTPSADTCDATAGQGDHLDKSISELQQITAVNLTPDERFQTPEYTILLTTTGNPSTGAALSSLKKGTCASSGEAANNIGSITAGIAIASILRKKGNNDALQKQTLFRAGGATAGCVETDDDSKSHLTTQKKVANAICRHRGADIKLYDRPLLKNKETLAGEANMRALAQLLATGKVNTKEGPNSQTEAVKALHPAGVSTLTADLVDPLENEEITYDKDNNPVKTTIKDGNKPGKFATTLAFCYGRRHRRKSVITAQKEVSDTKKEKCKEDKEKSKCIADTDCQHKDGKCKLKEGVNMENDGKTTNTTGSNSFVINKTSLWLAFLLF
uniref:Variant surface glycoprotein 1125.334 n=1 Tax=Trypanosoma brucei TaxID=5691 RepID=A0A1J0R497_9TRYP|nr:variant surface glycoprotein 1125.334 [Trypanosoma brucei]